MFARSLRLKVAYFLRNIRDNGFHLVMANLGTGNETTSRWSTECLRNLLTLCDRVELSFGLLAYRANLSWPFLTVLLCGVSTGHLNTLFLLDRLTTRHIVLHQVRVVLRPALADILRATNFRARKITVLDEWPHTKLNSDILSGRRVGDVARLLEVVLTLLLLLAFVLRHICGVTLLVVAVVALLHLVVLNLLHGLNLVNAPLLAGGNIPEGGAGQWLPALEGVLGSQPLDGHFAP